MSRQPLVSFDTSAAMTSSFPVLVTWTLILLRSDFAGSVVPDRIATNRTAAAVSSFEPSLVPADARQVRWAEAAFNYVRRQDCRQNAFATARECSDIQRLQRRDFNVYLADPTPRGRLRTVLPDGSLDARDSHDGVVVLDPFPEAAFGHVVVVFQVTLSTSKAWCDRKNGLHIGQCCMHLTSAAARCMCIDN